MAYRQTIENIFGAFVNQGSLEEAANWMADLAREDPVLAAEISECLNSGITLGRRGSQAVVDAVNRSGYRATSPQEAGEYCAELLSLYEAVRRAVP